MGIHLGSQKAIRSQKETETDFQREILMGSLMVILKAIPKGSQTRSRWQTEIS
jgi:hypothetical protein